MLTRGSASSSSQGHDSIEERILRASSGRLVTSGREGACMSVRSSGRLILSGVVRSKRVLEPFGSSALNLLDEGLLARQEFGRLKDALLNGD